MQLKLIIICLTFSLLGIPHNEANQEPEVTDISETTETDSDSSISPQSDKKIKHYRYPWEKTPEAWNAAMQIVQHKLRRKYPIDDRRGNQTMSVWYKNEVSIEAVQNITPKELNSPDYDGQPVQASIAVFVLKVKITKVATASKGSLSAWQRFQTNIQGMGVPSIVPPDLNRNAVQAGKVIDEDIDYFLVSIPQRPFSRNGINNPMANQLSQTVMTAALGRKVEPVSPPKLNNLEVKILFPSEKTMFIELKKSDVEALEGKQPSSRLLKQAMKNYPYAVYNPQLRSMMNDLQSSGFESPE